LKSIFEKGIDKCSLNCIDEWCESIEYAVSDKDPRRVLWMRDLLFDKVEKLSLNEISQSKYLKYLYSFTNSVYWRDPDLKISILKKFENYFHHPYEQMRESISNFSSIIFKSFWESQTKEEDANNKVCDEFLVSIQRQMNSFLKSGRNLKDDEEFKAFSRCIISWIFTLFASYVPFYHSKNPIYFISLLISILENVEEEIQNLVKGNLFMMAIFPYSKEVSNDILNFLIESFKSNSNWKVKISLLQFLQ
jgi:hypothetical protein